MIIRAIRIKTGNIINTYLVIEEKLPEKVGIRYAKIENTKNPQFILNTPSFSLSIFASMLSSNTDPNTEATINSSHDVNIAGK